MKAILFVVTVIAAAFAMPGDDSLLAIVRQPAPTYHIGDTVDIKLGGNGSAGYVTPCLASLEIGGGTTFHCWIGGPSAASGSDTLRFRWEIPAVLARKTGAHTYDYADLLGKTCTIKFASFNDVALTVTTMSFTVVATSKVLGANQRLSKIAVPVSSLTGTYLASGRKVASNSSPAALLLPGVSSNSPNTAPMSPRF
jgi:hypothetical protein